MEDKHDKNEMHAWDGRWGGAPSWIPGLVLIGLGVLFLLTNLTGYRLDNWWALFILIPAINNFSAAVNQYRHAGSVDRHARSHLFWGFFFVLLSSAFLFNVDFGLFWPAFIILAGLGMLLNTF
jgi:hypothetical protein